MSHHSSQHDPSLTEQLRKMYDAPAQEPLGPTRQFPRGKLMPSDEGETRIGIAQVNGAVVIDFGSPTTWIGFTPEQADDIAATLKAHAQALREENSQPGVERPDD